MVNTDDFSNRLQFLLETHELSAATLAEEIDINRSTLSHLLSGRNKPSLDLIVKLHQRFPDYSLSWLILGKEDSHSAPSFSKTTDAEIRKEEIPIQNSPKPKSKITEEKKMNTSIIERIVIFYVDGTFKEYQNV
ncbi:MAG: helix-turn-helix transcriptional regulator [Bacteroidetes bacterium]|jgi:transcriptional regulator with XRE-family HTH domain|nr:helix-turn-helix transcriptional regulator [Bacteroidota bacterium]